MGIVSATESGILTARQAPNVSSEPGTLLTVREVAQFIKVPVSWVYERTRRRGVERLPHIKVGKYLRFRLREIEVYLEALRRG
jgi:excisionase family DNA binding protein